MYRKNYKGGLKKILLAFFALSNLFFSGAFAEEKDVEKATLLKAGWLESIILQPWNIKLRAKLDTGAKTSSLHAIDIERFQRDGEKWVRFRTVDPSKKEPLEFIEKPLIRDVKIKRHKEKAQIRPVVDMTLCLDGQVYESEFSLIDRSRFNYQVLLGRAMLQKGILVDPAATFSLKTTRKGCKKLVKETSKKKESK